MAVRTAIKRAWLRRLFASTPGGALLGFDGGVIIGLDPNTQLSGGASGYGSFLQALEAEAFSAIDCIKRGAIASTQAGDRSTTFSSSGETQGDFAEVAGEMLDLYDVSKAALVAGGIAEPSDSEILTEMLDRLQPITEFKTNYTGLRLSA